MASREIRRGTRPPAWNNARAECADLASLDLEDVRGQAASPRTRSSPDALALLDAALHSDETARAGAPGPEPGSEPAPGLRIEVSAAWNRSRRRGRARRAGRAPGLAADVDAGEVERGQ